MNNSYFEIAIGDEVHIVEQNFMTNIASTNVSQLVTGIIMSQFLTKLMTVLIG